jgi:predicted transcriptional regulator
MKKTMTLNLSEEEMKILEQLAQENDLSKTQVLRQALRLYQMVKKEHVRIIFENKLSKIRREVIIL